MKTTSRSIACPRYPSVEGDELELDDAAREVREPHRVMRGTAALGRAAGVEDLEGVGALVQLDVRVAEDDGVGVREAAPHAGETAARGPRVVDDADRDAADREPQLQRQLVAQPSAVDIPLHGVEWRPERAHRVERL